MASALCKAKVLLLAVHFTALADIKSLATLSKIHSSALHDDILLRVLLTHLPETVSPLNYVDFLQQLTKNRFLEHQTSDLDISPVVDITAEQALKRTKRLHLLPLSCPNATEAIQSDGLSCFLFLRAHQMDSEAGMVTQLLDLLLPFLQHNQGIYSWTACTVLPYVRRSSEFESKLPREFSLLGFENLPDRQAIDFLLPTLHFVNHEPENVDSYLRSVLAPWLYDKRRWSKTLSGTDGTQSGINCSGWQNTREWLLSQATNSPPVAIRAIEAWGGPEDVNFDYGISMALPALYLNYFRKSYATLVLACVYTVQEATLDCATRLFGALTKLRSYLGHEEQANYSEEPLSSLPDLSTTDTATYSGRVATYMRNDLLEQANPLTSPQSDSTKLALALTLSALKLTHLGSPSTVRRVGDLTFLRDEREQRSEISKLLRGISAQSSNIEDSTLLQVRLSLLWLRDWGKKRPGHAGAAGHGPFGMVDKEFIETEFLKVLLSKGNFELTRTLYEDEHNRLLRAEVVREIVYSSALAAFDNATNPNRTRGGLKRCDDIIHALPATVTPSLAGTKEIQALLKATHALSDYRLVLKQGEPFSPVVLRVHSDPISIIAKVLEQNPKAYTRLQEFLDMGINIARAGLPCLCSNGTSVRMIAGDTTYIDMTEKRIIAMCIEAALREDDFETAYSYVASRLGTQTPIKSDIPATVHSDVWSWKAALHAGQYIRTERSQQPTHLGTASGNLAIRHLEQRIECLATALRVAPTNQLQEILKSFRRCEEQLISAVEEEAANEAAWSAEPGSGSLPGAFDSSTIEKQYLSGNMMSNTATRQTEEPPMSLFDLSRATARIAQRNFSSISNLQGIAGSTNPEDSEVVDDIQHRVRKRDQLREAATGTLVSGVGWLIGANVNQNRAEDS